MNDAIVINSVTMGEAEVKRYNNVKPKTCLQKLLRTQIDYN